LFATACFFFSSRRRHTRFSRDWSSDVCSSDLARINDTKEDGRNVNLQLDYVRPFSDHHKLEAGYRTIIRRSMDYQYSQSDSTLGDRKSTRLNSSHVKISYAVFCLKKKRCNNPV